MTTLQNEIIIDAAIELIWSALSNVDELDKYDPTVRKSVAISNSKSGVDAKRKVEMNDGKNWFEEECTVYKQNQALTYELTACSFPVHQLRHSYHFEKIGNKTKVTQVMIYQMKYGLFGKVMDALIIRKKSDTGIKKFLAGLKSFTEKTTNGL